MNVTVLRYGHRPERDKRTTTHVALVGRAFGAEKTVYTGTDDKKIIESVDKITKKWGGPYSIEYSQSWKKTVEKYRKDGYKIAHLTMYGIPLEKTKKELKKSKKILVIVGSQKVEHEVYEMADYNISITNQPHSEVAALAIFLRDIIGKKEKKFLDGKIKIEPRNKGKKISQAKDEIKNPNIKEIPYGKKIHISP